MKRISRLHRLPVFLAVVFFIYAAPEAPSRRDGIANSAAAADFKVMNKIFAEAHATAFRQIPAGELPAIFQDMKKVAIRDFVVQVLQYYRGIHVDHTGLGFSPELIGDLDIRNAFFPFPLKFFSGRAYLDCNLPDFPFASEVTHINGATLAQVLADLDAATGSKEGTGKSDDYRLEEGFSFLYYIAKGVPKEWRLTLAAAEDEKPRTVTLRVSPGGNPPVLPRHSSAVKQYGEPLFSMYNPSLKGSYLAINTFMPTANRLNSLESWNQTLFRFHQEARAKKSEFLVVDLRKNRGGVMLFSAAAATWFIDSKLSDKSRSGARTRMLPYREYVQAINGLPASEAMLHDTEKHLQTGFADKMVDGYFETRQSEARFLDLTPIPEAQKFKKIFVLIGPATYSAAVNFARLLKIGNKNVVLVGEETGSPGDGHSAEILVTYKLPASGLLFEIPLMRVEFSPLVSGQLPQRGLIPDIVVKGTAEDFARERDAVLDYVSRTMVNP